MKRHAWRIYDRHEPRINYVTEDSMTALVAEEVGDTVTILASQQYET